MPTFGLVRFFTCYGRHNIHSFTPQGLAMLAMGISSLGLFSEPLLAAISEAARHRVHECNPQDAAQILTAFAKFK
eukprot:2973782-Amphidinium_carterae.1